MTDETQIATTPEKVARTRRTHTEVVWTMAIAFGVLAALIVAVGSLLAAQGEASLPGAIAIGVALLLIPAFTWWQTRRAVRRADLYLSADGHTQFRVGPDTLTVADTVIPFQNITCIYFKLEKERYSSNGRKARADRAVTAKMDPAQREKLYVDGAMSWARLMIGVKDKDSIDAPDSMINPLSDLPSSGMGSGRLNIPFGAYLTYEDFEVFFEALRGPAATHGFPLGVVRGATKWAKAQAGAAKSPDEIRQESASLIEAQS